MQVRAFERYFPLSLFKLCPWGKMAPPRGSFILRQSACLVLNPITVYSYGFLFNCTTVGQASDSMAALT